MSENDYILSIFSPEKARKIETYQDILSILSTSSDRTVDSTYSSLESLNIFNNNDFLKFIIRKLIVFCDIFPFHIDLYVKIAQKINIKIPIFKELFLTSSFHRYYYLIDCSESNFILYMFYKCIQNEIFTFQELFTKFKVIFRQKYNYDENNILFFIYFSPEIKETDPTFFEEMNIYSQKALDRPTMKLRELNNYFLNTYQKVLTSNNFQLLRQYRNDGHLSENPLFEIIYHDDIEKLRAFLSNPNKSGNEVIYHSVISPYREVANKLSLISTAAVFSAVNCFKYLLLNGSRTDEVSEEMGSLAQDTIVGGNIEIIRFAQQNRVDFDGALTACANCFRNEIFEWIFELKGQNKDELTKQSPTGSTVFCQACRIGNIEIVLKCIELGVDLNAKDIDSTPISQAALGGCDEIIDILLEFSSYKASTKNQNQKKIDTNNDNKNDKNLNIKKNLSTKNNGNEKEEEEEVEEGDDNDDDDDVVVNYSDSDVEYDYDYDNFDFEDTKFGAYYRLKGHLKVDQLISTSSIIHSMREAAAKGQQDCIEEFVNRGFVIDIPLIVRAITYARFSTLEYLFQKVDFKVSPYDASKIVMTVYTAKTANSNENIDTNENDNNDNNNDDDDDDKDDSDIFNNDFCFSKNYFKIVYNRFSLISHFLRFLMKQNDVRVVELVTNKLKFGIYEAFYALLLLQENSMRFDMVDTSGFLILNMEEMTRIKILQIIPEEQLSNLLKTSKFNKEIINACKEYSTQQDIQSLPPEKQKLFEIANSINK